MKIKNNKKNKKGILLIKNQLKINLDKRNVGYITQFNQHFYQFISWRNNFNQPKIPSISFRFTNSNLSFNILNQKNLDDSYGSQVAVMVILHFIWSSIKSFATKMMVVLENLY
ncbi:hypothetical protein ACTA71_002773 [Dictyostelium dimigraforme]